MMAAPRSTALLLRTSRSLVTRRTREKLIPDTRARFAPQVPNTTLRFFQTETKPNGASAEKKHEPKIYDFKSMEIFSKNPSTRRVLIDAREPGELQTTGTIPGSINIPVTSQPDAFFIPEGEFENRFGFPRPSQDQELVFFCRSGVRSATAAQFARTAGWERVNEYKGSWLDWERNIRKNKQRGL